jgi:hypothetical protein
MVLLYYQLSTFIYLFVERGFTRTGDFTWEVSDCEELVGGYSQEMMGLVLGAFYLDGSEYGFYC